MKGSGCYEASGRQVDEFKSRWAKDGTESKALFDSAARATKEEKRKVKKKVKKVATKKEKKDE